MECSGRAVRKHRTLAAGEHGGHVQPIAAEQLSGDKGVDGLVDAVETAGPGSLLNRSTRQSQSQ